MNRKIKVAKERVRSTRKSLPYKKLPNIMISCMVENAVFCLNALTINSGMSCTIYPQTLMTGTTIDFNNYYKIEFGAYAEAQEKTFPYNSTQSCTEPAICLGPTGNLQGSYWFLNLSTGRHIKQRTFNPIYVPMHVTNPIYGLADADEQNPPLDLF